MAAIGINHLPGCTCRGQILILAGLQKSRFDPYWTRKRSIEMLKAGTAITVTVAPARVGGIIVLIMRILNDKGEELLGAALPPGAAPRPQP